MACVKSVLWPALVSDVVDVSLSGWSLGYWTACYNVMRYCTLPYCDTWRCPKPLAQNMFKRTSFDSFHEIVGPFQYKYFISRFKISVINIRRPQDQVIFILKWHFYVEMTYVVVMSPRKWKTSHERNCACDIIFITVCLHLTIPFQYLQAGSLQIDIKSWIRWGSKCSLLLKVKSQ